MSVQNCETVYNSADKWRISVLSGILFMLFSSPFLYSLLDKVGSLLGLDITMGGDCPTFVGLFVMTIFFVVTSRMIMGK